MFSDSDEDDINSSSFFYWNNWLPGKKCTSSRSDGEVSNSKRVVPISCKTWLPPKSFGTRRKQIEHFSSETIDNLEQTVIVESRDVSNDWGPRMVAGSSFGSVEESELTWNFFPAGMFGNFRLERNNYNQIVAYAEAEVDNAGSEEKAYIEVIKEQHLRSLLGLSIEDWNALIEALGTSKFSLKYEALKKRPTRLSVEETLWYFLCKRRHYLPVFAIRLRRNGAKKMAQFFDIFPKFRVEEIRTCDGKDAS